MYLRGCDDCRILVTQFRVLLDVLYEALESLSIDSAAFEALLAAQHALRYKYSQFRQIQAFTDLLLFVRLLRLVNINPKIPKTKNSHTYLVAICKCM